MDKIQRKWIFLLLKLMNKMRKENNTAILPSILCIAEMGPLVDASLPEMKPISLLAKLQKTCDLVMSYRLEPLR